MNWRDLLHIDIIAYLRGERVVVPVGARRRHTLLREILATPLRLLGSLLTLPFTRRRHMLMQVTEQLSRIVACNAPLVPALDACLVDAPNRRLFGVLYRLRTSLARGLPLSQAMRRQPLFFPRYYIDLIRAGENTGTLERALVNLSRGLDESTRLRQTVARNFGYLFAVFFFACGMVLFLCVKVFPVFYEILADFRESTGSTVRPRMPWITEVLDAISMHRGVMPRLATLIVFPTLAVGGLIGLWWAGRRGSLRAAANYLGLALPFFRGLVIQSNWARAARILQPLLEAGYPVDEALDSAAEADVLPPFARAMGRARDRVRQGTSLAQALKQETWLVPVSLQGMVSLGETSGRLPDALDRIAYLYESRVSKVSGIIAGAVVPIGVLALAGLLLSVYMYPFQVIAQLVDLITSEM